MKKGSLFHRYMTDFCDEIGLQLEMHTDGFYSMNVDNCIPIHMGSVDDEFLMMFAHLGELPLEIASELAHILLEANCVSADRPFVVVSTDPNRNLVLWVRVPMIGLDMSDLLQAFNRLMDKASHCYCALHGLDREEHHRRQQELAGQQQGGQPSVPSADGVAPAAAESTKEEKAPPKSVAFKAPQNSATPAPPFGIKA